MNRSPSSSKPVSKAISGFLYFKSAEGLADRTLYYGRTLQQWLDYIGESNVTKITSQDVSTYLNWLRTEYIQSSGFVTGGGWIDSPVNADYQYMQAGGKATFGFVAKYKKGANVPDGNTQFQFKAGDLNFQSSSYEWLVVVGNRAQFKGVGTINGEGSYKFMISADDDNPDTFRIQISGDNVTVYDNGSQQSLGGGSIVVHK